MDNGEGSFEGTVLSTWELKTIYEELYQVRSKWRRIGIELDIPYGDLDAIEQRASTPEDRLERVLIAWLSKGAATWRQLVDALWSVLVGETELAEKLRQKYCPQQAVRSPSQTRKRQHEDSDKQQDDRKTQQLNDIIDVERSFAHLQTSTRESLKRRGKSPSELAAHLLAFQSSIFSTTKDGSCKLAKFQEDLKKADSIDTVFMTFAPLCSFLDYSIFEDIINTYGSRKDKKNLKDYTESVRQFLLSWSVPRFYKVSRHNLEESTADSSLVELRIKLDTDRMLQHQYANLKAAIARILEVKTQALRVRSFENGCIVMVFFCPKDAARRLLSQNHAERSTALSLIEPSVLKVTISEEFTIYRKNADCPSSTSQGAEKLYSATRRQKYLELRSQQSDNVPITWHSRIFQLCLLAGVIGIIVAVLSKYYLDQDYLQELKMKAAVMEILNGFDEFELSQLEKAVKDLAREIKDEDISDLKGTPVYNERKRFQLLLESIFLEGEATPVSGGRKN